MFVKYRELQTAIDQISKHSNWHWGDAYRANENQKHIEYLQNDKQLIIKGLVDDGTYADRYSDLSDYNKWLLGKRIHESIEQTERDTINDIPGSRIRK